MRFYQALARALSDQGVDTVFGVLGDANLYAMDSFQREAGGRYVSMAHESGAVLAANGFARTSGRLGVASVTHGPGLTNTVTALVEGVKDKASLLIVVGDTAQGDREGLQNLPQRELVLATGAGFEQVRGPETLTIDVSSACRRALTEHRPIVLNVPVEFQWQEVRYERSSSGSVGGQAVAADAAALDSAVGLIATARRPVVLAGRGASRPAARESLIRLASRIGAPLATTLRGKDLFLGHPHNLGIFGTLSHELATDTIAASDCVIAFGASLNKLTTAEGGLLAGKHVVQVDNAEQQINRFTPVSVGVLGDASAVADAMVAWLDEAEVDKTGFASAQLAARLADQSGSAAADHSTEKTVDIGTALSRLEKAFPDDRSLVIDCGRFAFSAFTSLHVPEPSAYLHAINFGCVGLGMGNAIGAGYGSPGRPVLLICGDGGLMLSGLAEFNTAVRHGVDLVVVVLNDGAYGAEYVQFRNHDLDPAISKFDWPDFAPVAESLGGKGFTVRNLADLDIALAALGARSRPVLIDIKVDPDRVPMGSY